jgi:hypothetical protein
LTLLLFYCLVSYWLPRPRRLIDRFPPFTMY